MTGVTGLADLAASPARLPPPVRRSGTPFLSFILLRRDPPLTLPLLPRATFLGFVHGGVVGQVLFVVEEVVVVLEGMSRGVTLHQTFERLYPVQQLNF